MNVSTINPQQLRALVEDKWERDEEAPAVGLHVTTGWRGPSEVEFDFGKAAVVRADTVFGVREALRSAERQKRRIILLTRLQQCELGHDVVARLARCRLFPIDHWASLCALFRAKELDRSICDPAIAQALLEHAPADGYPPVSAGILDAGTVWRAVSRHVFEMGEREPDLVALLLWATSRSGPARYLSAPDELKGSLHKRLAAVLGEAAESVLRFIDSGAGADALALAVVCQVVFGDEGDNLDAAAARMEQYHGNKAIPKGVGRTLGRAAQDAVADLDRRDDPRIAQQHLQRADELLRQFRCDGHAHRSRLTLLGYEQRLARFGAQIESALQTPGGPATSRCEELQAEIADHRRARIGQRQEQASRAEMAVRLIRWLSQPLPTLTAFSDLATAYVKELSFVDWARESICRGEDVAALSAAYQKLDRAVLERREEFGRGFATALADWSAVGSKSAGVLGVEDVLEQVVAKVVEADNRVLLVVLDGMSWAVAHELFDDIRREHWFEVTLEESSQPPPPVIAAVPSVTHVSRASLLSGKVTVGDAAAEKRDFEANPALKACCDKRHPPLLFHKKDITDGGRGAVTDELTRAVLSPNHKVVGVVLNAIDDRLAGAQQVRDNWTINRIGPLGAILKLARDGGRVVVLASDHGHVWHRADARHLPLETGGRWRQNQGSPEDGELVVAGSRVRGESDGQAVIVPWTETIYYGRQQNGYHGGVSPQEMVCPLILLRDRSSACSGLYPCEYPRPEWWAPAPTATAQPVQTERTAVVLPVPRVQASLFDHMPEGADTPAPAMRPTAPAAPPATDWISRLLGSQTYKAQKEIVRRHAPDDEVVRTSLEVLNASGGIMTPVAFARAANLPAARLDGLVARMQRLLNVDGYEVLTLDRNENRVELNVARLKRQFDLE